MLTRSHQRHFDQPIAFEIGADALLLAWDEDASSPRTTVTLGGAPITRRRAALKLARAPGITRHVLAFQATGAAKSPITLTQDGATVAEAAVADDVAAAPSLLMGGMSDAGKARIVDFVLGACRQSLRLDEPRFARFARELIDAALPPEEALLLRPEARLTGSHALYDAVVSADLRCPGAVYVLRDGHIAANLFAPILVRSGDETHLVLAAPGGGTPGEAVLVGQDRASRARLPGAARAPEIGGVAVRGMGAEKKSYALRCLGRLAEEKDASPAARAVQIFAPEPVRELTDPKRPVGAGIDFATSCGEAGVFVRGWLRDPHGLVNGVDILSPFGEADLSASWRRLRRPDLVKAWEAAPQGPQPGFVALAPLSEPVPVLQRRLRLRTAGGTMEIVPPATDHPLADARNQVLSGIAPGDLDEALLKIIVAPAAAALHARYMATLGAAAMVEIGAAIADPDVSIVIPLYRNLQFLRLQMGAFAIDPEIRAGAEILYVLDSPEQREEVEHLLRGLCAFTKLSCRLVVMPGNFGYAAANNEGVRHARGGTLLLLNSDVVPLAPGWLSAMRAALHRRQRRPVGAVGPKLLFDDGSLQHAGLTFERDFEGRWYNTHFFKGYPRHWPAAQVPRSVPAITGAALLVERDVYESVGGFTQDYIIGDYEDSDLCLKIRACGYDIRYEPAAELYHFERRSIQLHAGYMRTAACAYNRRLHSERWSAAMAAALGECAEAGSAEFDIQAAE